MNLKKLLYESPEDWVDHQRYLLDLREDSLALKRDGLAKALEKMGIDTSTLTQNLGVMRLTLDSTEAYNHAVDQLQNPTGFETMAQAGWVPCFQLDTGFGDYSPSYVIQFLDVSVEPFNAKPQMKPDQEDFLDGILTGQQFSDEIKPTDVAERQRKVNDLINHLLECKVGDTVAVQFQDGSIRLGHVVPPKDLKPDTEALDVEKPDLKNKYVVQYSDGSLDIVDKDSVLKIEMPDVDSIIDTKELESKDDE